MILLLSRLIIEYADALRERFMILLYGFLLFYCIFWLLFILFLTVKYCWCRRKP